ncbi:Ubiquitin carboxyl-terminal hydrolase 27, partial [Cucurbita argyrosperma subsp. argyrosperma]
MLNYINGLTGEDDYPTNLASVVQHSVEPGVAITPFYRRVQDSDATLQDVSTEWFHVSDSEVHLVSEEEVLAAEATLLFYEKI